MASTVDQLVPQNLQQMVLRNKPSGTSGYQVDVRSILGPFLTQQVGSCLISLIWNVLLFV